jgi:hypothetical protein
MIVTARVFESQGETKAQPIFGRTSFRVKLPLLSKSELPDREVQRHPVDDDVREPGHRFQQTFEVGVTSVSR